MSDSDPTPVDERALPFGRPADHFRPFTSAESTVLRGFVADVRRLAGMRFFKQVPKSASLRFDGAGLRPEMEQPDDEALRAAITQFRQLYDHDEPHSFRQAMNVLKRSAHERGGPTRDAAITAVDGHIDAEKRALRTGIGIQLIFETPDGSEQIDTRKIIDAYFHSQYLHSGNPKTELARALDEIQPWPRFTLYSAMLVLRNVYWNAANAVDRVLRVPDLVDAG